MTKFFQTSQEYLRGLFLGIQEAVKSIYFTAYVISYNEKAPPLGISQIIDEICIARQRGVKVYGVVNTNINLPFVQEQTQNAIIKLNQYRCEIKPFPKSRILHAKLFVIDNCKIFIGSQNLSEAKEYGQIEASIMLEDSVLAGQIISFINLLGSIKDDETI